MKRYCRNLAIALTIPLSLFLVHSASAQPTEKQKISSVRPTEKLKMTAEEQKNWDKSAISENVLAKTTPAQKKDAIEKAKIVSTYFVKAVLNRMDPATYPLEAENGSPEHVAANAVKKLPEGVFKKISTKASGLMSDPAKRSTLLGKFKDIDFRKKSITPEVNKLSAQQVKPTSVKKEGENTLKSIGSNNSIGVGGASEKMDWTAKYNAIDLVLRAIHCVDETNPEASSDDMVIGGLLVGASGNTNNANGFDAGDFDDGTYRNYGSYPFGSYSLNTTSGYPKVFYCVIMLIESDSDDEELAKELNAVMATIGEIVASFWGLGQFVAAAAEAVDSIIGFFISDDPFYPYAVSLRLDSQDQFGSNGMSANKCTDNISDHGGTYRVGFKWQLKN